MFSKKEHSKLRVGKKKKNKPKCNKKGSLVFKSSVSFSFDPEGSDVF